MTAVGPLPHFIAQLTTLAEAAVPEAKLLNDVRAAMATLVSSDGWLPGSHAVAHPDHYQQYLLYLDAQSRFSVVSFVWGPGQQTPIHDHTIWGVVGQLRGAETSMNYTRDLHGELRHTGTDVLHPGEVVAFSPGLGDIHQVRNTGQDVAISIHVYGGDIGRTCRHKFDPVTGAIDEFVSGYSPLL